MEIDHVDSEKERSLPREALVRRLGLMALLRAGCTDPFCFGGTERQSGGDEGAGWGKSQQVVGSGQGPSV